MWAAPAQLADLEGFVLNIIVYLVAWVVIGLLVGFLANWLTKSCVWPWFWIDLFVGVFGAILFAFFLGNILFGMTVVLSAWSLLLALFGAVNLLLFVWLLRKLA